MTLFAGSLWGTWMEIWCSAYDTSEDLVANRATEVAWANRNVELESVVSAQA
jgi:hypothetical protein